MSTKLAAVMHGSFGPIRVQTLLATLVERRNRYRRFRRTFADLSRLSDRELQDLGLGRSWLRGIAWESAQEADD